MNTPQQQMASAGERVSQQRSLEMQRAAEAWACVSAVRDYARGHPESSYAKEYGSLARSATADIQINGLGQTLAFWRAKGYEGGRPKKNSANEHYQLLQHVSTWLKKQVSGIGDREVVSWIVNNAMTDEYRRATSEAIAFLIWVKRFAEAELD